MMLPLRRLSVCLAGIGLILAGCHRQTSGGLTPVTLQTDWYPQPEHGGFYDAQIRGYYKEEGLDVTILPGGPYNNSDQQVASGAVQFVNPSADVATAGLPRPVTVNDGLAEDRNAQASPSVFPG